MIDPVAKAKALQAQATHRSQEKRNAKRRIWEIIQKNHPDTAEFMKSLHAVFGKPEKVIVVTNAGERLL